MLYAIETFNLTKIFRRRQGFIKTILHSFKHGEGILVIDNLNLKVAKGEVLGVIGANGSGKTTLLKILASLIIPTNGEVLINGSVGLVTGEERSFYWRLTGRQNLEFFSALYGFSSEETKQKIRQLSKLLDIEKLLDVMFREYSAGYKQILAVVRSLLRDPDIFLFDELNKSLDVSFAERLRDFVKELVKERQKTVIFAAHNKEEFSSFTSNVAMMDKGKLNFAPC